MVEKPNRDNCENLNELEILSGQKGISYGEWDDFWSRDEGQTGGDYVNF
jgi:hypothetical protein